MAKISATQLQKIKEGPSGTSKKYRMASMGDSDDSAVVAVAKEDDDDLYENFYKYSDPKAAKRDYENFKSEAEMSLDMKKGGYVRSADGIAKRGKTRGRFV